MNPQVLANFIVRPDAEAILTALDKLAPDVRAAWVISLNLLAGTSATVPEKKPLVTVQPPTTPKKVTGETLETRIIELRLAGETIEQIRKTLKTNKPAITSALRQARANGIKVSLFDRSPKNEFDITAFAFAQRMAGVSPSTIVVMVKRDLRIETTVKTVSNATNRQRIKFMATFPAIQYSDPNHPPEAVKWPWKGEVSAPSVAA